MRCDAVTPCVTGSWSHTGTMSITEEPTRQESLPVGSGSELAGMLILRPLMDEG